MWARLAAGLLFAALSVSCAGPQGAKEYEVSRPPAEAKAPADMKPSAPSQPAARAPDALRCDPAAAENAVERLRGALNRLSGEGPEAAVRTSSEALCTLAVALEKLPSPGVPGALTDTMRWEAALLADPTESPFSYSARVRAGLDAAVSALEQVAAAGKLEAAGPWLESARRSVDLIERDGLFELQRATIQDAFRTVSAAFAIILKGQPKSNAIPPVSRGASSPG